MAWDAESYGKLGSALGSGLSTKFSADTKAMSLGDTAELSRRRAAELRRRAELRKKDMWKEKKKGKSQAYVMASASGFSSTGSNTANIHVDYETQLYDDITALEAEAAYEIQLELDKAAMADAESDRTKKAGKWGMVGGILGGVAGGFASGGNPAAISGGYAVGSGLGTYASTQ